MINRKALLLVTALVAGVAGANASAAYAVVRVDASRVVVERDLSLIGGNIEDLNFQLYGGLYSQLLFGECFEEHVDPSELLGLSGRDRLKVWVLTDAQGRPRFRYFDGRRWGGTGPAPARTPAQLPRVGGLVFRTGDLSPEDLPGDLGRRLIELATGATQVSRHWRAVRGGSVAGTFTLVREGVLTGAQAQRIEFTSGQGEWGIDNAGLFRTGINLSGGRSYEGLVRIRSDAARRVFVSLRGADGCVLAEEALALEARPGEYQRLTFTLTPTASDPAGRFALLLKGPGAITVDYAFLQAGDWGRFKGLPVRRELAEAVLGMGVKTLRYDGSMVNLCPDGQLYKWKQMIGPRDERPPYHGWFNPYASHGFSVFEFLDFCEAADILPVIGLRIDESDQDMKDLVEYCLGGPETTWGRRRTANGHPRPYALHAVEIGNEQRADEAYLARFKALASAIWSRDSNLVAVASVNVRAARPPVVNALVELARWTREQEQEKKFVLDSHYRGTPEYADTELETSVGFTVQAAAAKALPGFNLRLWPLEENGDRCTWERGLAHAHNLNTMNRLPANLERAGTANTLQAWNLFLIWNQGRIHFTPSQTIFQPSYYVDRMFGDEWLPRVVSATSTVPELDVTAKMSRDGKILTLYLVNIGKAPIHASFEVAGFAGREARVARLHGTSPDLLNTPENPAAVAPRIVEWTWDKANARMELPAQSFTTVRLAP